LSQKKLRTYVEDLNKTLNITPRSILATIYGDMLIPHGGTVWLGSLVTVAKCFGINEALARTSALRLGYDGWLHSTRVGKYSYYSMASEHTKKAVEYYPRVYGDPRKSWSGAWYFLLTGMGDLSKAEHANLRQEILWFGAGQLTPYIFIMVSQELDAIEKMLRSRNALSQVQIMKAEVALKQDPALLTNLAAKAWNIEDLSVAYNQFLDYFRPLWQTLERIKGDVDAETAFMIRTLLITEYRKLAIRDPRLPDELLPQPWSGYNSFTLCRSIYQKVIKPSEAYLSEVIRTADGGLSSTPKEIYDRFGGFKK